MPRKKADSFRIPAEIVISARSWRKLVKYLDEPGKPTKALRRLMQPDKPLIVNCPPVCGKCMRCHHRGSKCPQVRKGRSQK